MNGNAVGDKGEYQNEQHDIIVKLSHERHGVKVAESNARTRTGTRTFSFIRSGLVHGVVGGNGE